MIARFVFPWLMLPVLTYTLTAPEILNRVEAALARAEAIQVQLIMEDPDGNVLEERTVTIPSRSAGTDASSFPGVPYSRFTGSKEALAASWPFLTLEETPVTLDRLSGTVCYLVKGNGVRLWLDKGTYIPLRIETLSEDSSSTITDYLDMVHVSEKVRYPARTEVRRDGSLLIVERILPAAAGTEGP
ncbi:MAG: hypothetical protein P1S46_10980 [bacterium]|nr:hypothetical protein [bacterium]MDT8396631.1 hypothetical protein [bacterium]